MVCVGEGENALIDLCDRLEKKIDYSDVTNLWVKLQDGKIKKNSISKHVDINQNPLIDISLFEEARLYTLYMRVLLQKIRQEHLL